MSASPPDLPGLDPDEFVGGPPAGEGDPSAFTSNDQSADEPTGGTADAEPARTEDTHETEDDT